jgi:hypothetical protein
MIECLNIPANISSNFILINSKLFRTIKDVIKYLQGKSKEENKKIEGTSFGFPKIALLDYPIIYLEKIFVKIIKNLIILSNFIFILSYNI